MTDEEMSNVPVGEISDGFHTFAELYEHRNLLMLALMDANPRYSWYSDRHEDGSMFPGMFVAGTELRRGGAITYHMPSGLMDLAKATGAKYLNFAPKWDGHTPADVVDRLAKHISWP